MNETLFYVLGGALVAAALIVSAIGIRSERFPGGALMRLSILVFVALVGGTAVFSVANARDEQQHRREERAAEREERAAEKAEEEAAEAGEGGPATPQPSGKPQPEAPAGPGGTIELTAAETALAYDKKTLASKPGEITIDFTNPSQIQHDVVIERGSEVIAQTDLIIGSETSTTAAIGPGTYTFYCSVPGHRESGMEGTLTVK